MKTATVLTKLIESKSNKSIRFEEENLRNSIRQYKIQKILSKVQQIRLTNNSSMNTINLKEIIGKL